MHSFDLFFFFFTWISVYFKTLRLRPGCNQATPDGSRCGAALSLIIVELPGLGLAVCGFVVRELCSKDDLLTISPVSVIVKYVNVVIPLFCCVQVDPLDFIIVLEEIKRNVKNGSMCSFLLL
ncbi:Hemoglobin subunit theta-1 [Labeo rohita]|uniref:Hemoglobin subunit theta-1 n=1 Tax=Labeo rohita TaxID=84645 RepID=A0ABQ8MXW9_LABRO|nr:Hemoglobin subunit theta-1 [Labeo rohita]